MSKSKALEAVLNANKEYVSTFGAKKDLPLPPSRKFAILTCMDARLDPAKFAGLSEGDAHVILINCSAHRSGLSFTIPTVVCLPLPTKL